MKANELRIGNIVNVAGFTNEKGGLKGGWTTIEEFTKMGLYHAIVCSAGTVAITNPFVTPVPLTEEWLLKFGFNKVNDPYDTFHYERKDHWVYLLKDSFEFEYTTKPGQRFNLFINRNYVHQLQNLYFELTGEELKER